MHSLTTTKTLHGVAELEPMNNNYCFGTEGHIISKPPDVRRNMFQFEEVESNSWTPQNLHPRLSIAIRLELYNSDLCFPMPFKFRDSQSFCKRILKNNNKYLRPSDFEYLSISFTTSSTTSHLNGSKLPSSILAKRVCCASKPACCRPA